MYQHNTELSAALTIMIDYAYDLYHAILAIKE